MPEHDLMALVEEDDNGRTRILAPRPAVLLAMRERGDFAVSTSAIGRLEILGRLHRLILPDGVQGRIVETLVPQGEVAVEYRQPLAVLGTVEDGESATSGSSEGAGDSESIAEGSLRITAPSHGIFYRRPDPDSPPYVEVGETVAQGAVLGLVEVMKCFNQIRLEGAGLPARVVIESIACDDGQEVEGGQTLFVVRSEG